MNKYNPSNLFEKINFFHIQNVHNIPFHPNFKQAEKVFVKFMSVRAF